MSLLRSWKIASLAVFVIAVSLFVGGAFLAVGQNLAGVVERARDDSRVVVYFEAEAPEEWVDALAAEAALARWVEAVHPVDPETAAGRFAEIFPALADLVEGDDAPLPASLEIEIRRDRMPRASGGNGAIAGFDDWLARLARAPGVSMVDDDRDWVAQLSTAVAVVRSLGAALGGVLLFAAIFTISSVIRLTVYLYEEEIAVMRLVGATEFYIRGPFYVEGLLQGVVGGALAAGALAAAAWATAERLGGSLVGRLLVAEPPSPAQLAGLVGLGAAAGLVGAVLSLRKENLGEPPVDD